MHRLAIGVALIAGCGITAGAQQVAVPSSATQGTVAAAPQPGVPPPTPQLFRGTRANGLTSIQGNALTETNGVLPNAVVRLRDARFGRVLGTQVTDNAGLFAFRAIEPGSYVVELMGADQTVLAASEILDVDAGDVVSSVVKLPWHKPPAAGLLGRTTASAIVISSAAAATGVLAAAVVNPPVSGEK